MIRRRAKRSWVTATRVAPWLLAATQSWMLERLLTQHRLGLAAYDEFHHRLDRLERTLERLAASPHPHEIASSGPSRDGQVTHLPPGNLERAERRIFYRPVTLKNGSCFDVAIDIRRLDPITWGIVNGQPWFLDDFYVLLDRMRPGDTVLDLGGYVATVALGGNKAGVWSKSKVERPS